MSCGTTAPARMQLKICRSLKAKTNFGPDHGCTGTDRKRSGGTIPLGLLLFNNERISMKKTDAEQQVKRAQRQVANTSGGGHLGGTNHGQGYDAKTSSAKGKADKGRKTGGKS
ncbi:Hypothetical protein NGAL_HAMBI1146_15670 [Neorhizobium galegae bv. officinalis]|nr:Hypothetical protein NGAL_HAMBI1146_15670 [Neorhizobium galegae bv. officinalis]